MKIPLSHNSIMECRCHGERRPAFICKHLQYGEGLGFNQPNEALEEDWPFQNAWCDECENVLLAEGEWNDRSEGFAGILAICDGCFEEIKARNESQ